MRSDDYDDDYSKILGKRIEKFSFFYSLSQVWKTNFKRKKLILVLLILIIIGAIFIVYSLTGNKLSIKGDFTVLLLAIGVVIVLISPMILIFVLLEKLRFDAGIYSKGINLSGRSYLYTELKELKLFQYPENGNEYIKLIYTKYDDRITTEDILYNPKMDTFLNKLQETLETNGINCERIIDIKNIKISESVEYEAHFWFFKMWKLLSGKEKMHRIKNVMFFIGLYLFFGGSIFVMSLLGDEDTPFSEAIQQLPENFYSGLKVFLILLVVLVVFLTIHFIYSVKKFYARMENNAVYIHNGYGGKGPFLSDNYVLSKIKVNYGFIVEGNIEGIMLIVDTGDESAIYKRPKNEETERFCSELADSVKKYKYS